MVKSKINRVPSGKDVRVVMNVPEADMSLVTRSKTYFLSVVMVLGLTGSGKKTFQIDVSLSLIMPFFANEYPIWGTELSRSKS